MREILFRGKRVDNGEWVEGFYSQFHNRPTIDKPNSHQIFELIDKGVKIFGTSIGGFWHIIDPETIGQFTGLLDKNGKKIFEGDIVDCWSEGVNAQGTVQQRKDGLWIIHPAWQKHIMWGLCPDEYSNTTVEVIGNIHDNPELLKEGVEQ